MTRREEIVKAANEFYKGDEVSTFVVAAQWADKTMIEKACEQLMLYGCEYATEEVMVEHFKKAMEEQYENVDSKRRERSNIHSQT